MNAVLLLVLSASCGGTRLPTATLSIAGHPLTVEVAANDADRARGLMHRDSLPDGRGMVFVYADDAPRSFWMKDTRIPLSIAFVDRDGTIVRIADMQPLSTKSTPSLYPARYAIEVNKGWFADRGIEAGAAVGGLGELGVAPSP